MKDPRYIIDPKRAKAWAPLLESPGLKRVLQRKRWSRGLDLYPGVMSDSPDTLRMLESIAVKLTDRLTAKVGPDGVVGSNAIAGNFYNLLTTAGYGMDPASIPPMNNSKIRESLHLRSDFKTSRHKQIATILFETMFSNAIPAKLSIRREASTGSPDYVNDVPKKKSELRNALSNLDDYLSMVDKGELLSLYVDYNSPIVQTLGERTQADSVTYADGVFKSKDREVNDELAARTSLASGRRFIANKNVVVDGNHVKNHFSGRRRAVYGMAFVPNYVVASIFTCLREYYLDRYAFTWKHRTPDSILAKMTRYKYLAGFDVKQFDQSVPTFLIDFFCDQLRNTCDHRVAKLIKLMFSAPYIVPHPSIYTGQDVDPIDPLFGENPFDPATFNMELGLPSGISCNPDFGKFAMVFQYLCVIDDYFGDVIEHGIPAILMGEHEQYALLNMGDDCVLLVNDDVFYKHINDEAYAADYFAVEREEPISFLGNVPYRTDSGELKLAPNIASFFVNWLVPEHGVSSNKRKHFWAVGDRERRQHYSRSPSYPEAYDIYEEEFSKYIGRTPSSITAEYYDTQRKMNSLSFIDALVLQNPDYLQYRFDPEDVSPEILDLLITSIPSEEIWDSISFIFK